MNKYSVTDLMNMEWREFANYSTIGRAIPSMVDGLKSSQRFFLAASLDNTKSSFDKVASVAGSVAKYGYKHGENNAADAGVGLAQAWENNACLIQGRGSFGTRLVPKAAAPRYIYSKVHPNFDKLVADLDLCPPSNDPEFKIPMHYIPVVPLLLVNGSNGIATGFKAVIFPRLLKDVVQSCLEYIKTGKVKNKLVPGWNDFKGTVVAGPEPGKYFIHGAFERQGKTGLTITEVPIGFDRESYVELLDDLEDAGEISGYVDSCGKEGFCFKIQLRRNSVLTDDDIVRMFRLVKPVTEIFTTVDWEGNLRIYDNPQDIIKDFCDYRKTVLEQRIQNKRVEMRETARFYRVKAEFVRRVLDGVINFKGKKKDTIVAEILTITEATEDDADRLLRMNLMSLTKEMVDELVDQEKKVVADIAFWDEETWESQFKTDLSALSRL